MLPEERIGTLLYFSVITLSGVSYGGIIPVNPYVRLIAALENMIGIFLRGRWWWRAWFHHTGRGARGGQLFRPSAICETLKRPEQLSRLAILRLQQSQTLIQLVIRRRRSGWFLFALRGDQLIQARDHHNVGSHRVILDLLA
jgi:hypothetical protein